MSRPPVVCVTRPAVATDELVRQLEASGANVIRLPLLRIEEPEDLDALRAAARDLCRFDLVAFTSRNAVEGLFRVLPPGGMTGEDARPAIAAVGPSTARALEEIGALPRYVPSRADATGLADLLESELALEGLEVLLPLGDRARRTLPQRLSAAGARVTEVCAYRTVTGRSESAEALERALLAGEIDVVTFTSGSAVSALVSHVGDERAKRALERARVAVIGETTATALAEIGVTDPVVAARARPDALCRAALGSE